MSEVLQRCRIVNIPGTPGANGSAGAAGASGSNAWASLAADFTMPAQGATGTATLDHTDWLTLDLPVWVEPLGTLQVVTITGNDVELRNLQDGAGGYAWNLPPGTVAATTERVTPTGFQGLDGDLSGAAGGDLQGTYPDPTLIAVGTAGTYGSATTVPVITTDNVGRVAAVTNTAITFPSSSAPSGAAGGDLTGTYPNPTLGVTGVAAATYGSEERIPAVAVDLKGRITSASNKQPRYGILGKLTALDLNTGGATQCTINSTKYIIRRIIVESASISLTTATLGVFTSGAATIAADQALSALTASTKWHDLTISSVGTTDVLTGSYVNVTVGTPQGAPATANVWIEGENLA